MRNAGYWRVQTKSSHKNWKEQRRGTCVRAHTHTHTHTHRAGTQKPKHYRAEATAQQYRATAAEQADVDKKLRKLRQEEKRFSNRKRKFTSLQQYRHAGNRVNEKCRALETANNKLAEELGRTKKRYVP